MKLPTLIATFCRPQAVVLDDELDADLVADIRLYIERLLDGGLRARLIALIKVRTTRKSLYSENPSSDWRFSK